MDAAERGVPSLTLDLPAAPESVAEAIARARDFATANGAGVQAGAAISLAVGEAVDTAIRAVLGSGCVRVMLDVEDGDLEFVVCDDESLEVWMRFPLDR